MADWDAAAAGYNADLAARRGAGAPATLGEIWNANWSASGLDTLTGSGAPLADAFNNLVDAASAHLGPLPQAARDRGLDYFGAPGFDGKAAMIGKMVAGLPDDQQKAIAPLLDIRGRAADAAAKTESDAADVAGRTYGLSGIATSWLASIARQVVDPANVALMFTGGPETGGALSVIGRQALTAAAGQAIQEPVIQANRADLGLDSGIGRAAADIGEVGAGAAALPLLFRGAAWALRNTYKGAPLPVSANDFDAAALVADRDRVTAQGEPDQIERTASATEVGKTPVDDLPAITPAQMSIDDRGNNNFFVRAPDEPPNDSFLSLKKKDDGIYAGISSVAQSRRGQGIGTALYERAVQFADEQGLPFRSDISVSTDADHVYDALKRRGYQVTEAPGSVRGKNGIMNASEGYVYEVRPPAPPAPEADLAAPTEPLSRRPIQENPPAENPEAGAAPEGEAGGAAAVAKRIASDAGEEAIERMAGGKQEQEGQQVKARPLGNPQLAADADRTLADAGGDFQIEVGEGPEARTLSARQALAEAREDAAAARELEDCIGGTLSGIAEAAE